MLKMTLMEYIKYKEELKVVESKLLVIREEIEAMTENVVVKAKSRAIVEGLEFSEMLFELEDWGAERFYQRVETIMDSDLYEEYTQLLLKQSLGVEKVYNSATDEVKHDIIKQLIRRNSRSGALRYDIFNEFRGARLAKIAAKHAEGIENPRPRINESYKNILISLFVTNKYSTRNLAAVSSTAKDTIRRWCDGCGEKDRIKRKYLLELIDFSDLDIVLS